MKKLKVFLVSLLAMLTVLFCFTGCGVKGVYQVEGYELPGGWSKEVEESTSYIEIKDDNVVEMDIAIGSVFSIKQTGIWVELDEENKYEIRVPQGEGSITYGVTLIDEEMVVDFQICKIILEKQD